MSGLRRISLLRRYVMGYLKYGNTEPERVWGNSEQCAVDAIEELADTLSYIDWGIKYETDPWRLALWWMAKQLTVLAYQCVRTAYKFASKKARVE